MSSHKFPVNHRLVHAHEFDRVFKECEFRIGNAALLFLAKPNHQGFNRLGMVVSKKSVPLAVDRNRIKRQIRETFRKTLTDTRTAENLNGILADSFTNLLKRAENPGDKA